MFVSLGASELMRLAQQKIQLDESDEQEIIQIIDSIIEQMEGSGTVKEQEKEGVHEIKSLPPETRSPQRVEKKVHREPPPQQVHKKYKPIAVTKTSNYTGKSMKVVVRNGLEHKGRLKNIGPDKLIFARLLYSGKFAFELKIADIKSLQVYL